VTEEGRVPAEEVGPLVERVPFLRQGWELLGGDGA
jgi:hypothetical protein